MRVLVEIYSRPGCHLCEEAKETIERVRPKYGFELRIIDIESQPGLESEYGEEIPVVFINGSKAFKYRVNEIEFEKKVNRLWRA
jgi:glutaredoxin